MMRESKLLIMLGFQKSMDNRVPITTALFIEDGEGNRIVTVDLDEHQMVGLLSGSVIRAEGRVAEQETDALAARLEAVEALADEWEQRCELYRGTGNYRSLRDSTDQLWAALRVE